MKKITSILLILALLFSLTACSAGSGSETAPAAQETEATESSFTASAEEAKSETEVPQDSVQEEPEADPQPETVVETHEIPVIAAGDLGTAFEFGFMDEGLFVEYENSGNEYQVAWYNEDSELEMAFHELYGAHYMWDSNSMHETREFHYTTDNGALGHGIHYVNLETREDRFVTRGILYEALSYGYFNGRLLVYIEEVDAVDGSQAGYYIYESDGRLVEYVGSEIDETYIKTGEHKQEAPSAPEPKPEPEKPAEPAPQPEPEKPVDSEPESAKSIVVGESDVLTINVEYQFDLSGNGELDTFEFIRDGVQLKFVVNGVNRYFKNMDADLTSNEYRIVDLNPSDKGMDLEILEAAPPYEQTIHFIRVKAGRIGTQLEYFGPLTVSCEAYENDRVLYQGNDQIMVIEMSNIVTAFYQKFYQLDFESIRETSRPDITKYMNPLRTTLNKDMLGYDSESDWEPDNLYAGDEINIFGEHNGDLWIEYLGETSSQIYWLRGYEIEHYPDSRGQYQFNGVQFWS